MTFESRWGRIQERMKNLFKSKTARITGVIVGATSVAVGAAFTHIHHNDSWQWNSKWMGFGFTLVGSALSAVSAASLKKSAD